MQAVTRRIRLFSDADGSTPIAEVDKLLQALAERAAISIGSRYLASSVTAVAAEQLFPACTVDGWSFDLEVLATARAQGVRIREVPVR